MSQVKLVAWNRISENDHKLHFKYSLVMQKVSCFVINVFKWSATGKNDKPKLKEIAVCLKDVVSNNNKTIKFKHIITFILGCILKSRVWKGILFASYLLKEEGKQVKLWEKPSRDMTLGEIQVDLRSVNCATKFVSLRGPLYATRCFS